MIITILKKFLPLAFLSTVVCGLVYLEVQQSLRISANDPQIQMAEDAAAALATSSSLHFFIPSEAVDISNSLAPYIVVYDASQNPVAGNGLLEGVLPNLPSGVFDYAKSHGEERFTWQPRPGVRQAAVLDAIPQSSVANPQFSFVLAARSLREVEIREDQAEAESGVFWLISLIGLLILEIGFVLVDSMPARPKKTKK